MLNDLLYRLRALCRRKKVEAEMDDELNLHVDLEVEKQLHSGHSREEAMRLARLAFGGRAQIQEDCREARGTRALETAIRELRYSVRILRKSPGFTLLAVLTLALGIGASTAIFSVVEAVLLRPLPFHHPARLVVVNEHTDKFDGDMSLPAPDVLTLKRESHAFTRVGGYCCTYATTIEVSGAGKPMQVPFARLTADVLPALGIGPALGRFFTPQEDEQSQPVALLSYAFWKSAFQEDPHVAGRTIDLDRKPYTIIGVMPREFQFPLLPGQLGQAQLWIPMSFTAHEKATAGDNFDYGVVARLRPGVTLEQAKQDADRVMQAIQATYPPQFNVHLTSKITPLKRDTVEKAKPFLRILFAAVMMVLLIACANLAGLLLVRALRRRREIAMRLALGAKPAAVLRQALWESLLLSLTGCMMGILMALAGLRLLVRAIPETLPRVHEIGPNWIAWAFAVGVALLTAVLCGLAPAFAAMRTPVNDALKERADTTSACHARLRSALVVGEVAIALVLLSAAGLLFRSFERMREVNPGFRPERLTVGMINLPVQQYGTGSLIESFHRDLLAKLQALPGVRAAALGTALPIAEPTSVRSFAAEGFPAGGPIDLESNTFTDGDYLAALGVPLLRGRYINNHDTASSPLVVVVDRTLAEHYWPGQDPIGKKMKWGTSADSPIPWMTVVGEVADTKLGSLDAPDRAQAYEPITQRVVSFGSYAKYTLLATQGLHFYFVVRSAIPPEDVQLSIQKAVWSLDRQLTISHMQTMEQAITGAESPRRFNTAVFAVFALGAVLLAALGIYGVTAFAVLQRAQEMAIRMALGAQRTNVLRLVLISGAKLAVAGSLIGLAAALATLRLLRVLLFDVSPFDPLVLAAAILSVLLLALLASFLPARRAASVDPMRALRAE